MKEMRVRRMLLGTRQRFPVQAGTGAKAPPDPPFEPIPAAFHARLVLLKDETPSFCFADRPAVGMRPRAPGVSAPPRAHTDTARAAVRELVQAGETEILQVTPTPHARTASRGSARANSAPLGLKSA
jgi:hypothetical protein